MRRATGSTAVVAASTLVSRILGFIRLAVIGAVFGGSGAADVVHLVFTIPNNLRKLTAEGALSSAFIPVLSQTLLLGDGRRRAARVVSQLIAFQAVILVPILVLSTIFAGPVVSVLLDFPDDTYQDLAVRLFRFMIHYTLLISISAVVMGALNSHNRFLVPAVTPILFSVSVILSIGLLHRFLGVFSVAVGVLVGGLAQILFQYPLFSKLGHSLRPAFAFKGPEFRRILRRWLPVLATAGVFTINQTVAVRFASALEPGSGAALSNALTFWQLPFGVFSASVTTVLFPRMSRQVASNDKRGLRQSVSYGIRYLFSLLVPSAVVLGLMGHEIIAVALQRGAFEAQHTALAAKTLAAYSWGLFSVGAYTFLQRFFYAHNDYRRPLITAAVAVVLDIVLSLILKETSLRVAGLALANSIAFTVAFVMLLIQASRMVGPFPWRSIVTTGLKVVVVSMAIVAVIVVFTNFTGVWWVDGSSIGNVFRLAAVILLCVGITLLGFLGLRVEVLDILRRKGTSKE